MRSGRLAKDESVKTSMVRVERSRAYNATGVSVRLVENPVQNLAMFLSVGRGGDFGNYGDARGNVGMCVREPAELVSARVVLVKRTWRGKQREVSSVVCLVHEESERSFANAEVCS